MRLGELALLAAPDYKAQRKRGLQVFARPPIGRVQLRHNTMAVWRGQLGLACGWWWLELALPALLPPEVSKPTATRSSWWKRLTLYGPPGRRCRSGSTGWPP